MSLSSLTGHFNHIFKVSVGDGGGGWEGRQKKRNLFCLLDVFQLILVVCPPVLPKPSWMQWWLHSCLWYVLGAVPLTPGIPWVWTVWELGVPCPTLTTNLGKHCDILSLRTLKLHNLLSSSISSAVCQAEPAAPSPKAQDPTLGWGRTCRRVPAPRKPTGAGMCAVVLPFPSHLSQQPHIFDCIYGHLICASSQDQIYLQVLISFRLIEVQAHEVSVFDPQIGYESQSNRLIFTRRGCPGLQAAREKSMKSANDSQFIEQLPF